uniref:Uncharacterized protein n=1 Tax=Human herpesvirus 1 TaxID=10298 RepID=A0A2Z4HBN8_HHV1|nr:hypothetical protein [Human alphaherpesvirus 1]
MCHTQGCVGGDFGQQPGRAQQGTLRVVHGGSGRLPVLPPPFIDLIAYVGVRPGPNPHVVQEGVRHFQGPRHAPPPRRAGSGPRNGRSPPTSRKRSTQRSPPVASTRAFLLREGTNAGEPPPPPPRPPSSAPASPLLRPRVPPPPPPRPPSSAPASPPPPPTQGAYPCKKGGPVGFCRRRPPGCVPCGSWVGWAGLPPPASACPFPMRSRSRAGASRCRRRPLRRPSATPAPGPRAPQPLPSFVAGAVCGRRSRRAFMCAGETRPPPPGPAPGAARSRARRQCSHFALIIYIYWDEVRTLRVLTSFTRRPRPLGAVPPAGQWGGGKAGGPWAARRPVGPGVRRAGPGARGRPTGARGSYLITAEPGSRGPGPAPGPFLVSMRNGSGNRRIGR